MAGPAEHARAERLRAVAAARAAGDPARLAQAALDLAANLPFGVNVGSIPAHLHEAYLQASGRRRVRLAAALARTWAYGYEPERGAPFAAEAVAAAAALDDSALLADALDAQLLAHWGPDDLAARVLITARLGEAAAHLPDVEARMSAYLWRLSTALESLDTVTVRRQLRALDDLATESGSDRVRLFADSRAAMHALVVGDVAAADRLRASAVEAGAAAAQADTDAVAHELRAWIARQRGDVPVLVEEAESFEQFGGAQGIASISAQAAVLWVAAGEPGRARAVLDQVAGADFSAVPRDVDWLLTVSGLTEVAAATGAHEPAAAGARLLEPYAGRAVVNSGAVTFAGVVDDVLRQAHAALDHGEAAAHWAARAAAGYQRLGASWWLARLELPGTGVAHLVPGVDGVWTVGSAGRQARVRDVKGLHYLRLLLQRPGLPVPALELSAAVAGHTAFEEPGLEVLDRRAVSAYRRRLAELDKSLDDEPDGGRRAALSAERGMLLDELGAATGLSGRARSTGASAERARVAVQKSVASAIRRVGEADPALGRLLRDTVRTGNLCVYEPDPARAVRWVL
jgi:hypothetical protein